MADLATTLCGIRLRNPLILASGPLSWNADAIRAAFVAGAAAVVTKTIRPEPTVNPVPHISSLGRGSMLNTEGWSDLSAEQWINQELPALANRDGVLIASTGHTPAEVAQLAGPLAQAGADMLELVSYRAEDAAPMVAAAKQRVPVPVLIKVSANWPNVVDEVGACLQAGADGVTAIDSIGPALRIDVDTGRPLLGSFAWLSGAPILPIALRTIADIRLRYDVPVVGTGGAGSAEDIVEMMLAGATAVGAHTAPLLQGLDWFGRTLAQLREWLEAHGHTSADELRGLALPYLEEPPFHTPLVFTFDTETCTACGRCVTVCAYAARHLTSQMDMVLDKALCHSCGLCATVCPTGALRIQPTVPSSIRSSR